MVKNPVSENYFPTKYSRVKTDQPTESWVNIYDHFERSIDSSSRTVLVWHCLCHLPFCSILLTVCVSVTVSGKTRFFTSGPDWPSEAIQQLITLVIAHPTLQLDFFSPLQENKFSFMVMELYRPNLRRSLAMRNEEESSCTDAPC